MSYCRSSERDCDVLAWGDQPGMGYCIAVAHSRNGRPIHLPYAGDYFREPTLEAFRDRLLALQGIGFRVPSRVFARISRELESS